VAPPGLSSRELAPFKELLLQSCGFSLENERERTLQSGIERRMGHRRSPTHKAYLDLVRQDPEELDRLIELLTVNETYFFREPEHLNLLVEQLVPELRASHPDRPVSILCAGCSTGEEPYSVAMLLRERHGADREPPCAIKGVDIDARALAKANRAVYGKHSFRGMDPALLARHFEPCGAGEHRVLESLRRKVVFGPANLASGAYPELMLRPDIILYRNVSIYFPAPAQQAIFRRLAGLLDEGGFLIVGAAETLFHDFGALTLVSRDGLYLFQKTSPVAIEDRRQNRRPPPERVPSAHPPTPFVRGHPPAGAAAPKPSNLPLGSRKLFDDALAAAQAHRMGEALALLDELIAGEPSHIKAHSLKGSIFLSLDRLEEAKAMCDRALALDPLCVEACLMLGIIASHREAQEEALGRFREAIYLDASCWLAHYSLANILFLQGDRKRARSGFETALRLLEQGRPSERGHAFFPLSFNAEQFITICRHKLALMKKIH
jgi:chemotaxis protein methyltransferase CheR